MEMIKRFFLIFTVITLFSTCSYAFEEKKVVRVGISDQGFSTFEHSQVEFISSGEFLVTDLTQDLKFPRGTVLKASVKDGVFIIEADNHQVIKDSTGPIVLTSNGNIAIANLNRKGKPAMYLGQFELKTTKSGKFNIINVLDMQSYLRGVVPNEMPTSFGLEALKAQAVAARNYANRPQNAYSNYDVCDSTACQVYYGANSYASISDKAVEQTDGIFATYKREPILALYSSTGGGVTESYENTFGQNAPFVPPTVLPYLVSVSDNPNFKTLPSEEAVRDFYSKAYPSYDIKSPRYRWRVEWSAQELEGVLNKTLLEQSKRGLVEPLFDANCTLQGLESIKVLKRGDSGKALLVEISSRSGKWRVKKELAIRRVFQKEGRMLSSANFFVDVENDGKANLLERAIFDTAGNVTKITFTGGGFGHGVGMSQYGAGYMASEGRKYPDILRHYYTGIAIGTAPITVSSNVQNYKIDFYAENAIKYLLKFDNTKRLSAFDFTINSTPFSPNMGVFEGKILYFDVTKYLRQGSTNEIRIYPLSARDRSKTTKVWIEMVQK